MAPLARLTVCGGPHAGSTFVVTDRPVSIGVGPQCDVILEAQGSDMAPVHARIWHRDGRFMIHQVAGDGSVLIAGRPLVWGVLENGDELLIGPHRLTFELAPAPGAVFSSGVEERSGRSSA